MSAKPWLKAKTAGEAFLTCTKRYGQSWAEDGAQAVIEWHEAQRVKVELGWWRELDEWRIGKRRVFWRIRWHHATFGYTSFTSTSKKDALASMRNMRGGRGAKLYRVTVRPKGAKR